MKIKIKTTHQSFVFGFDWQNPYTHDFKAGIILGFIVIHIYWKM